MARKLFEKQGIRRRGGPLASGVTFVVYSDVAGTALADISATSGGSAIAGSEITTADIAGLGPAAFRFYGPTDGTDTLYLRCPTDSSLGVQEIEADEDERLDALEAGSSGIPGTIFDAKGDIIAATAADTASRLGVGANGTVLTAASGQATGLQWATPSASGIQATIVDAKGDLIAASAADTVARLAVGTNGYELVADSAAATGLKWLAPPVIDVKAPPYNATGDGTTDDRAALQAAADAVPAGGATLYFPPGTYLASLAAHPTDAAYKAALVVKTGTRVLFAGGAVLKLAASQTGTAGSMAVVMNKEITAGGDRCVFEDVVVDGNGANQSEVQHGILLIRTAGAKHTRCRVLNCRGTASSGASETFFYETQLGSDTTYTDCEAVRTAGSAASGFSTNASTNVGYKGCTAVGMTVAHGFTHNSCDHVTYVGCNSYLNTLYGFNSEASADVVYDACTAGGEATTSSVSYPFTAGQSLGNASAGFVNSTTIRYLLNGCVARKNLYGALIAAGTASGRVLGGSFTGNTSYGVVIDPAQAATFMISGRPLITGNSPNLGTPGGDGDYPGGAFAPTLPATGVALTNPFCCDVMVYLTGGTVTLVVVNGVNIGITSGTIRVPACQTIAVSYSSAPSWLWITE